MKPRSWPAVIAALAITAAAVITILGIARSRRPPPSLDVNRVEEYLPLSDSLIADDGPSLALSPDGRLLAYVARRGGAERLFVRPMDHFVPDVIGDSAGARSPFFSDDGRFVGFVANDSIRKASLSDSKVTAVCQLAGRSMAGASWKRDGTIVMGSARGGLARCQADGKVAELTQAGADARESHRWPEILPDQNAVVFAVHGPHESPQLAILSLQTGKTVALNVPGTHPHYASTGHIIFTRSGDLWAVPFRTDTLAVSGTARMIEAAVETTADGASQYSFSRNGRVFALVRRGALGAELVILHGVPGVPGVDSANGRASQIAALTDVYGTYRGPRFSPDGRFVAVARERAPSRGDDIWVFDTNDGKGVKLTDTGHSARPTWSSDGLWVMYAAWERGEWTLNRVAMDERTGAHEIQRLLTRKEHLPAWLGGHDLLSTASAAYSWPLAGDTLRDSAGPDSCAPVLERSPDRRWFAYAPDPEGVVIRSATAAVDLVRIPRAREPRWSADGRSLFYRDGMTMYARSVAPVPGAGRAEPVFEGTYSEDRCGSAAYDVSPAGDFVLTRPGSRSTRLSFVFDDLFERIRRAVPAR